jgi:ABC-type spermidine/putrescine transport system permease subunit I
LTDGGAPWVRVLLLLPLTALLAICFTVPLVIMLLISVSQPALQSFEWSFTLASYARFLGDRFYSGSASS